VQDGQHPDFMNKVMESPKAMEVITKLTDLLQQKGINVRDGKLPSMMQMAKIAMDSDIRAATGEGKWVAISRKQLLNAEWLTSAPATFGVYSHDCIA
jgi:D-Tyr-tRNAtyr deacylase